MSTKPPAPGSQLDLRKLFVVALLIGAAGIVLGQWLGSLVLAVSLPLAVMVIYITLGFYKGSADTILEQFADSIYYLGFLFTLLALVVSLYAFRAETLAIGQLVGNFALALVTTITGLASRIVITNFQGDDSGRRRQLRDELEQSTQALILNARAISLRLDALNNEVHYTLGNAMEQTVETMARTVAAVDQQTQAGIESLSRSVAGAGEQLATTVADVRHQLSRIDLPQDLIDAKLADPLDQLVQRFGAQQQLIDQLLERHGTVLEQADTVTNGLDRVADRVTALEQALAGFDEHLDRDRQARAGIVELAGQLSGLLDGNRELSATTTRQAQTSARVVTDLEALVGNIATLQERVGDTTEALTRGGGALTTTVDAFTRDAERSASIGASVAKIADAFAQAGDGIEPIRGIGQQMRDHAQILSDIEALSREQLAMLQRHQADMEQTLAAGRDTLATVNRHFVDAVEYVSERLGEKKPG